MAIILEEIYEVALHRYNMKLVAGGRGLRNLVDWVHTVEEMDYVSFLKGRELIVTTGIKEKDEEMLECFVKSLYEAGASGLVINVGKYITRVPHSVITYSEEVGFPIFVLPWEVHLVDFNRDLCNLIYKTMQEQDSLETALQKAIFHIKKNNSICRFCMNIIFIKTQKFLWYSVIFRQVAIRRRREILIIRSFSIDSFGNASRYLHTKRCRQSFSERFVYHTHSPDISGKRKNKDSRRDSTAFTAVFRAKKGIYSNRR